MEERRIRRQRRGVPPPIGSKRTELIVQTSASGRLRNTSEIDSQSECSPEVEVKETDTDKKEEENEQHQDGHVLSARLERASHLEIVGAMTNMTASDNHPAHAPAPTPGQVAGADKWVGNVDNSHTRTTSIHGMYSITINNNHSNHHAISTTTTTTKNNNKKDDDDGGNGGPTLLRWPEGGYGTSNGSWMPGTLWLVALAVAIAVVVPAFLWWSSTIRSALRPMTYIRALVSWFWPSLAAGSSKGPSSSSGFGFAQTHNAVADSSSSPPSQLARWFAPLMGLVRSSGSSPSQSSTIITITTTTAAAGSTTSGAPGGAAVVRSLIRHADSGALGIRYLFETETPRVLEAVDSATYGFVALRMPDDLGDPAALAALVESPAGLGDLNVRFAEEFGPVLRDHRDWLEREWLGADVVTARELAQWASSAEAVALHAGAGTGCSLLARWLPRLSRGGRPPQEEQKHEQQSLPFLDRSPARRLYDRLVTQDYSLAAAPASELAAALVRSRGTGLLERLEAFHALQTRWERLLARQTRGAGDTTAPPEPLAARLRDILCALEKRMGGTLREMTGYAEFARKNPDVAREHRERYQEGQGRGQGLPEEARGYPDTPRHRALEGWDMTAALRQIEGSYSSAANMCRFAREARGAVQNWWHRLRGTGKATAEAVDRAKEALEILRGGRVGSSTGMGTTSGYEDAEGELRKTAVAYMEVMSAFFD